MVKFAKDSGWRRDGRGVWRRTIKVKNRTYIMKVYRTRHGKVWFSVRHPWWGSFVAGNQRAKTIRGAKASATRALNRYEK